MSANNYILKLPNIKNNNIFISEKIEEKVIKGFLSYTSKYCPCCGVINESTNDIIKWRFRKNCIIKTIKKLLLDKENSNILLQE